MCVCVWGGLASFLPIYFHCCVVCGGNHRAAVIRAFDVGHFSSAFHFLALSGKSMEHFTRSIQGLQRDQEGRKSGFRPLLPPIMPCSIPSYSSQRTGRVMAMYGKQNPHGTCTTSFRFNSAICYSSVSV